MAGPVSRFIARARYFERDRIRQVDLEVAGYRVLRFTHRRMQTAPDAVAGAICALLSQAQAPFRLSA